MYTCIYLWDTFDMTRSWIRKEHTERCMMLCKAKRQYLLTCKVSRYFLLALNCCIMIRHSPDWIICYSIARYNKRYNTNTLNVNQALTQCCFNVGLVLVSTHYVYWACTFINIAVGESPGAVVIRLPAWPPLLPQIFKETKSFLSAHS